MVSAFFYPFLFLSSLCFGQVCYFGGIDFGNANRRNAGFLSAGGKCARGSGESRGEARIKGGLGYKEKIKK